MMEEFDFEDEVLSIHPEEDIRKIDVIDIDTNSNHPDEDCRKIDVIDIDTDSNHPDEDISKIDVIDIDSNSVHPDEDTRKVEVIEIDKNKNIEQASDSDSGEIDDDEETNDLEEGEIKDSSTISKKKSDIACRFFKRGSCVYGSQCQYLHVSDTVYKMFDTKSQKRNDVPLVEHHSFPNPIIFPPNVLPPRPFIEPPIPIARKTDFQRPCDMFEDTWERGLEQTRIMIRKANLKKKNEDSEEKKLNFKNNNNKDEKSKGQYFTKADLGNELRNIVSMNNKKDSEKNSTYNILRKDKASDDKKLNYRFTPKSSDKWVDPWRRSKSPTRKRLRSVSGSPPSRSRKHSSTSSTSSVSSSSEFDGIYRPYEKKSPGGQQGLKSRSRSISQSRRSKKQKVSPKRSFNGKRDSRSASKSFSISPFRKRTFSSRTLSRSSSPSSSSCSNCCKSPTLEDKKMKRISAKLGEQISRKSPKRASELIDSDCETSEMTVSSASCTSLSSDSEDERLPHIPYNKRRKSPYRNNAPFYSNKSTGHSNPKGFNRNQSYLSKSQDLAQRKNYKVPAYQRKIQPSDNRKNQNNWSFRTEPTDRKPKNTTSNLSSVKKPASAPKFSKDKMTGDMELLFMYQGLGNPNNSSNAQKGRSNNPTSKPNGTEDSVNVTNKANGNSELYRDVSKAINAPKKDIVLNLQSNCKGYFKHGVLNETQSLDEMVTVKKETASKRELLLNKLKLIDDAIARKKGK